MVDHSRRDTPREIEIHRFPREPVSDPTLGLPVSHEPGAGEPRHRLVAIGDALVQGFMDGAIYRTDLSWPAIIAFEMGLRPDQFTYPNYELAVRPRRYPHRPAAPDERFRAVLRSQQCNLFPRCQGRAESSSVTLRSSLNGNLMAVHALIWQRTPAIDKGFKYGDMSLWSARPHEPAAECRSRVKACDIYVGIIGSRSGSIVPDE